MEKINKKVPKIIWFLWFQGIEKAPSVVKKCLASWKAYNPEWKMILLDEKSLSEYLEIKKLVGKNYQYISKQSLSDLIRINLLKKFGGVWVDATCYCCKPLDDWLPNYMSTGFFAFYKPGIDRPISSWFLASSLNSKITLRYCNEVNKYWSKNHFSNQEKKIGKFIVTHLQSLMKHTRYETTKFKFLFFIMNILKVYPYFWFHYIFALIIRKDKSFKKKWESTNKYSADIPHRLQQFGLFKPLSDSIKLCIVEKKDPLYKLKWKNNDNEYFKDNVINYLLEQ